MTCWGGATGKEAGEWASRLLAVQFHGDAQGGVKVFKLLGLVFARAQMHIDLVDLLHRILELGFMGRYRGTPRGPRELEDIRRRLEDKIMTERRQQAEKAEWERANPAPTIAEVPYPYAPYVEKRDWVHSVWLGIVLPAVVAVVIGSVWWFFF